MTSRQKLAIFKKEAERLRSALGLTEWSVDYTLGCSEEDNGAELNYNYYGRKACIALNPKFGSTASDVRRFAKHEVAHLLLAPLAHKAQQRFVQEQELDEAEEAIVRKLEEVL